MALIMCLNFDAVALYTKAYTLNFDMFFYSLEWNMPMILSKTVCLIFFFFD